MWLYERRKYASEKNGKITCRKLFGRWEIFVGGFHETSRYLRAVWRDAYARLPADFSPRRILIFGLAGGDNVVLLNERFPAGRVTAVEWDPVMVRIADELQIFPPELRPDVIVADGRDAVATLAAGAYDLVLVDMFRGPRVAQTSYSPEFLSGLRRIVAPGGFIFANGFAEPQLFEAVGRHFTAVATWKTKNNRMALFRKPLAEVGEGAVR